MNRFLKYMGASVFITVIIALLVGFSFHLEISNGTIKIVAWLVFTLCLAIIVFGGLEKPDYKKDTEPFYIPASKAYDFFQFLMWHPTIAPMNITKSQMKHLWDAFLESEKLNQQ